MEQKQIIAIAVVAILIISAGVAAVLLMGGGGEDDADVTEYTLTYNVNGGNPIASKTFTKDTNTFSLETPVKDDATFLGWYDNSQLTGSKITQVVKGTQKNIAVWAKWQLALDELPSTEDLSANSSIEVTLGSSATSEQKTVSPEVIDAITGGKSLTVNNVDAEGNTVLAWTFNGSDSKNEGYAGAAVDTTVTPDLSELASDKRITLDFAYDGKLPYTSTIRYSVGVAYAGETLSVKNSGDAEPIGTFVVDEDGYVEFDIDHCSDWVLQVCYTFTFNANGGVFGDGSAVKTITAAYNYEFAPEEVPVPTKAGHDLAGWNPAPPSRFTEDATTVANWTPSTYGIEYNHDGGAFASGNGVHSYTYGTGATLDDSIRAGYIFEGWYDNEGLRGSPVRAIGVDDTGAKTYYAKWGVETYTITYKDGDRTLGTVDYTTLSEAIPLPTTYAKDGYDFVAWYENSVLTGDPVETVPTNSYGDKTFYAKWSPKVNTITYMDGVSVLGTAQYTIESDTFDLTTSYTKEGQAFSGWYDNAALSGNRVVSIQQGTFGDKTFYAKWEAYYIQVTVRVDDANESDAVSRTIYAKLGEAAAVPLEKVSAGVYKWTSTPETPVAASGTYKILVGNVVIIDELVVSNGRGEGDIDYYAVDFDVDGIPSQTVLSGDCAIVPSPAPEQAGCTFSFWRSTGESAYNFATPVTSHLDLYAEWEPITYVVKYLKNDEAATGSMDDGTATFGADFTPAACGFTKTVGEVEWRFIGWNTKADLSGTTMVAGEGFEIDDDVIADLVDGNIALHAMWSNADYVPTLGDMFTGTISAVHNNAPIELDMKSVVVSIRGNQYLLDTLSRYEDGPWEVDESVLMDSGAWPVFGDFFDAFDMASIQSLPGIPGTHVLNGSTVAVTRYAVPVEGETYVITVDVVNSTGMVCYISEPTVYRITISIDAFAPAGFNESHSVRYRKSINSEAIVTREGAAYADAAALGFSDEDIVFFNWTALVNGALPEPYYAGDLITTDRTVVGNWGYVTTNINWDFSNLPEGLEFYLHEGDALLEDAAVNDIMTLPGTSNWQFVDEADDVMTYSFRFNDVDYKVSVYLHPVVNHLTMWECHTIVPSISDGMLNIRFAETYGDKFFARFLFSMNSPELKGYEAHVGDRFVYEETLSGAGVRWTYVVTNVPGSAGWDDNTRYEYSIDSSSMSESRSEEALLFDYPIQVNPSAGAYLWHRGAFQFGASSVECYFFEKTEFTQGDGRRTSSRTIQAVVGCNDGITYDGAYRLVSYTVENDPASLHDVTFNGNGGLFGDMPVVTERVYGIKEISLYRAGFELMGWSTENDATVEYSIGDAIREDCTLYAVWGFDGAIATVDLDGGESSGSLTAYITAPMGSARSDVLRSDSIHAQKGGQAGIGFKIRGTTISGWDALVFNVIEMRYVESGQILSESRVQIAPGVYVDSTCSNPSSSAIARATNAYVHESSDIICFYVYEGHEIGLIMQYGACATIVYDPGTGVGAPITMRVPLNGTYVLLPDETFSKDNWEFKGWKDDATYAVSSPRNSVDNAKGLGFNYNVESITLHAVWGSYVDVHYDANGGVIDPSDADVRCVADGNPTDVMVLGKWDECTREGYKLVGWATAADATTIEYVRGTFFAFDQALTGQRITLYAIWASEDDAFEFVLEKGEYTPPGQSSANSWSSLPQNLAAGISMPISHYSYDLGRATRCLVGWNTSANGSGTPYGLDDMVRFDSKPGSSFVLYAQWVQLTVNFDSNGGTGSMEPIQVDYRAVTVLPANGFLNPGYAFAGWTCSPDLGTPLQPCIAPGDVPGVYGIYPQDPTIPSCTLSPIWIETHAVDFDTQGGPSVPSVEIIDGGKVDSPGDIERGGYTFNGWFTQASGGEAFDFENTTIEEDVTIYAQWIAHAYDLVLNYGIDDMEDDVIGCVYGTGVALPEDMPSRTGYTFDGWHSSVDCECDSGFYQSGEICFVFEVHDGDGLVLFVPNEDDRLELHARWTPITYIIKFHANGGTGTMDDQVKVFGIESINGNEFSYEASEFDGWNTYADGSGTAVEDYAYDVPEVSEVVNLYAQWTKGSIEVPWGSVTVAFNANDGRFLMYGPITGEFSCGSGPNMSIPSSLVPTMVGYLFGGWHSSSDCICESGFYQPGQSYPLMVHDGDDLVPFNPADSEYVELYAIWTPISYTVEFDANGGSGVMANQSKMFDGGVCLDACTFTRAGYAFDGWNTEADGSGDSYWDESDSNLSTTDGATVTLYAQWREE